MRRSMVGCPAIAVIGSLIVSLPASAGSDSGEIRTNITLKKDQWNSIDLPQMMGLTTPAFAMVNYDLPVQIRPEAGEPCTVLSQLLVDDTVVGLQTISVIPVGRTSSIHESRSVRIAAGNHSVKAQLYPECEGASVTFTTWSGGVWGGNYSYGILPDSGSGGARQRP